MPPGYYAHHDRGELLADAWHLRETMIGLCAEIERQRGEATEMEAALARLKTGGAAALASELRGCIPPRLKPDDLPPGSPGEIIVRAAASVRVILDAAGRVVQEAKHHHCGKGRPLEETGGLSPGLRGALRALEEATNGG